MCHFKRKAQADYYLASSIIISIYTHDLVINLLFKMLRHIDISTILPVSLSIGIHSCFSLSLYKIIN